MDDLPALQPQPEASSRRLPMIRNAPRDVAVFGVDLGKSIFHVVGLDERGAILQRAKFRRDTLLAFFERAARTVVGMEACPGSQWLARKLQAMGRQVRIVPAQFVKPHVKSQKNDTIDAAAIAEAVTRPTMRFTQVRSTEQVDLQALHQNPRPARHRPHSGDQPGPTFCLEYGIAIRQGTGVFRIDLPRVLADESNDLTPAMRRMLSDLFEDVLRLDERITGVTREIEDIAARDDRGASAHHHPGIGPLAATALLAAVGDGRQFRRARDLAAWLGLTPREYSTGGKTTLLGISKRGNRYVRRMLVHGARSCVTHLDRTATSLATGSTPWRKECMETRSPSPSPTRSPGLPG